MATVTLNRTTKIIRVDLTDLEFSALDGYVKLTGPGSLEGAITSFINSIKQDRRERDLKNIRARIDALPDAKRDAILAIVEAP